MRELQKKKLVTCIVPTWSDSGPAHAQAAEKLVIGDLHIRAP
jgi:hypothetical protein